MARRNPSGWLFGSLPDLLLGAGLLYLVIVLGLFAWGPAARDAIPATWMAYLVLVISGSHYGGTLLRVYEHRAERETYRFFTVYGTLGMVAVLLGALYSPLAGSILITVYLTWSPWHYTGQNYGIALMFLRRRGVEITPLAKRLIHASFVFSFLSVLLTMHFEGVGERTDPLDFGALDLDTFRFISAGLPTVFKDGLMPLIGLGCVLSAAGALFLLVRTAGFSAVGPTALLMLTQAVWFSIPYLGTHFKLVERFPELFATEGATYHFYFVWVALGHAAQYLWIVAYYARTDERWRGYGRYFTKVFVFGNAVWAAPVILFGPDLLGSPDYDFGLAMCVASAVNIHHFILDGAIWKLRNPKLAAILLRGQAEAARSVSVLGAAIWTRRIAWTLAGLFCLARIVPYVEIEQRFPSALARHDYATAESILDRARFYGRDSAILRTKLANQLAKTRTPAKALRQIRRSLELHPLAAGYIEYGVMTERFVGLDQAVAAWEDGVEKFPEDVSLKVRLGDGFLRLHQPSSAIVHLEAAVEIDPDNEVAQRTLARARTRVGVRRDRSDDS